MDYVSDTVEFLHRTVRDFLLTKDVRDFLTKRKSDNAFNANSAILLGHLASLKAFPVQPRHLTRPSQFQTMLLNALYYARQVEVQTGHTEFAILEELAHVMDELSSQHASPILWYKGCHDVDSHGIHGYNSTSACDSFFQLTIQQGLSLYVQTKLMRHPVLYGKDDRPLLDYALQICPEHVGDEPDLTDIVRLMLDLGRDPNERFGNGTVWSRFLHLITVKNGAPWYPSDKATVSHRHRLIDLLLLRGADPAATLNGERVWTNFITAVLTADLPKSIYDIHLQTIDQFLKSIADVEDLELRMSLLYDIVVYVRYHLKRNPSVAKQEFFYQVVRKSILAGAVPDSRFDSDWSDFVPTVFLKRYWPSLKELLDEKLHEAEKTTIQPRSILSWIWLWSASAAAQND